MVGVLVVVGAAVAAWSWLEPEEALGDGEAVVEPETVELAPDGVGVCAAVVAAVEALPPR